MKDAIGRVTGVAALAFSLAACSERTEQAADSASADDAAGKIQISGAGATFPQPLYERWIGAYSDTHPDVVFSYEGIGSGAGIKRFLAQDVDFGASDAAMSDDDLAEVGNRGAVLVPMTAGMVVLAYNLPGFDGLQLSREAVVGIFNGEIDSWSDPRIQDTNPGVVLPNKTLTPVVRRDSSGTTFVLTNHLSAASEWWRTEGPGTSKRIDWPGHSMEVNYNEGVAQRVKVSQGSIGYMEYEFAQRLGLPIAILENRAGEFVSPAPDAGTAALASAEEIPDDLRVFVPDPPGAGAYPIVSYTWLLLYGSYPEAAKGTALKDGVIWALTQGQPIAEEMGYIQLPERMIELAKRKVESIR
ncbi:MAG: phosphate ABC transporter substrate-binding protein PstS [Thiohalocapsa sp.]